MPPTAPARGAAAHICAQCGYTGLIAELLDGEFLYREEGLLDRTHPALLHPPFAGALSRWNSAGPSTWSTPLHASCPSRSSMPPLTACHLRGTASGLGAPDALSYQFICMGVPAAATQPAWAPPTTPAAPAQARFTAQLYLGHDGHYSEARKPHRVRRHWPGTPNPAFRVAQPVHARHPVAPAPGRPPGVRALVPPGLGAAQTAPPWQWSADTAPRSLLAATPHSQIVWASPLAASSGRHTAAARR